MSEQEKSLFAETATLNTIEQVKSTRQLLTIGRTISGNKTLDS
ncbi:MAG: hypothetical protein NY202_01240 [Mollicutes bacterium UO1]